MKLERILKFLLFYIIGILLLLISVFLSDHISYNAHFISELPIILPIAFSIASIAASPFFILDRNYPWFFSTGIASLLVGVTLFAFGIILHSFAKPIVWASSLAMGVLFILAAFVRLIIQGGLSAYRKSQDKNQDKNLEAKKYILWEFGIVFLISGISGISISLLSDKVYSFENLISILSTIVGVYFIQNAYRKVHRGKS